MTVAATDGRRERLLERAEAPIRPGAWGWKGRLLVAVLGSIVVWGVFAWIWQLKHGLAVTGLNNHVSWAFYLTNFVFFIGISHAGTLVSAILRLSHAGWRRPITRLAEMITVVALLVGASMVVTDMGRPDRLQNLVIHAHLRSPILWDVLSISTYIVGSLLYLFLPMVPDLAILRDGAIGGRVRRVALPRTLAEVGRRHGAAAPDHQGDRDHGGRDRAGRGVGAHGRVLDLRHDAARRMELHDLRPLLRGRRDLLRHRRRSSW